jgi:alkylhydroperoxidase family enzyme
VRRADADSPVVLAAYDYVFGDDRCPVERPGTADGTRGDWWTTYALVPDVLQHAIDGFLLYRSRNRVLDPRVREAAQLRVGARAKSRFVERQHARAALDAGLSEEAVEAVRSGGSSAELTPAVCAALAYVDALVMYLGSVPPEADRELSKHFDDREVLELTYIATLYLAHAVASKALQLEDDNPSAG